jgi:predicted phosphodiesterase
MLQLLCAASALACVFLEPPGAAQTEKASPEKRIEGVVPGSKLPVKPNSVRFAVIGDSGTGDAQQHEVARTMQSFHDRFPFEFVLMLGDNIYGTNNPRAYKTKFEEPYQALLSSGIKFYAALGNHDEPDQRLYKPFNMDGKRYYSFRKGDVRFLALDSNYMSSEQISWLRKELSNSPPRWTICYFHHPLYSGARFHGPDLDLRKQLEPILSEAGVDVVLSGHEHVYERLKPQNGIAYFVMGSGGELRRGDLRQSPNTAKGYDADRAFVLMEVAGDDLYFQAISRTGETVDSGVLTKPKAKAAATGQ